MTLLRLSFSQNAAIIIISVITLSILFYTIVTGSAVLNIFNPEVWRQASRDETSAAYAAQFSSFNVPKAFIYIVQKIIFIFFGHC